MPINSQVPPAVAPRWSWEALNEARKGTWNTDQTMEIQPADPGYMPNVQTTPPPPPVWMANAPQNPLMMSPQQIQQLIAVLRQRGSI